MILVTGANGFIGKNVVKELQNRSLSYITLNRNSQASDNIHFIQDISQPLHVENLQAIKNCDTLIHLAWNGLPHYKELYHIEENLMAQYNFIKACIQAGVKNITITGTCLEYGLQEGELSTDTATKPFTSYAIAKDCLHKMVHNLQEHFDFNLKWVRLFYVYGEGQAKHTLYGQLIDAVHQGLKVFNMSTGDQQRDYLHISKVAKYIVDVSQSQQPYKVYNCSSGNPLRVLDFVNTIIKENKFNIELNTGYYSYPDYEPKSFWGKPTII
ncbi:MAG: NAD-dependent epimerase/dehydratase family protein [Saprospiraceae bacterium]|nr:NAD-dependent epimerase/dehydratase family protein [Saprospiraceae bacterium]